MVGFIDTHCHLTSGEFARDLDQVLMAAQNAGVERIVIPSVDLESSRQAVELVSKYPQLYAAIGVQPEFYATYSQDQFVELERLADTEKVVAIGEIGLDFHYQPVDATLQQSVLKEMLKLASKVKKPVLIHSRDAIEWILRILTDWINDLKQSDMDELLRFPGIIHAFEGDLSQANEAIRLNYALGVGGPITYKSAALKRTVFESVGLDHLVLETDAPYLPPHPYRGMRNEPARVKEIAEKLAEISHQSLDVIATATTLNANQIFGWKA